VSALAWCCGVGLVTAAVLAWSGLHPGPVREVPNRPKSHRRPTALVERIALGALGALLFGVATSWPVAAIGGAVLGIFSREVLAPRRVREAPIERTEAIAGWAEQLRDTMAGAAGLQEAIVATAPLAPAPIRAAIQALALRARREALAPLLVTLADELADPTADLVCSALVLAAAGDGTDLGEVLSALAESARDEATMRRFIDASRARTRTAVRAITGITVGSVVLLFLFAHRYLAPYSSVSGQLVLAICFACYGAGIFLLVRMSRERAPERLLSFQAGRDEHGASR